MPVGVVVVVISSGYGQNFVVILFTMNNWCLQWILWVSRWVCSGGQYFKGFHFRFLHWRFQCGLIFLESDGCPGVTWRHLVTVLQVGIIWLVSWNDAVLRGRHALSTFWYWGRAAEALSMFAAVTVSVVLSVYSKSLERVEATERTFVIVLHGVYICISLVADGRVASTPLVI